MAGPDVTQGLPTTDNGVTSAVGMPAHAGRDTTAAPPPGTAEPDDRRDSAEAAEPDLADSEAAEPDRADSEASAPGVAGRRPGAGRRNYGGEAKSAARSAASRVARRAAQPGAAPAGGQSGPEAPSGAAAVRRRLARLGAARVGAVNPVLEPLIKTVRTTHPK